MRWRRGQGQSFPLYFQAGHYSYGSYRSYSTSGASIGVLANVTKCWLSWDKSAGNLLQKRSCLTRHWSTWENWTCDWKIFLWEMRPCFFSPILSLSLSIGKLVTASCTPFLPFSGGSVFGCLRFTLLLPLCTVLVEAENISGANHPTSEAPQTFIRKYFYDMHSFLRKCCSDLQCMQCRTGGSSKDWVGVVLKGKSPAKPRAG